MKKQKDKLTMQKRIMTAVMAVTVVMFLAGDAKAGSLDAPAAPTDPASAMFTLEDIYQKLNTRTNVSKRTGAFTEPAGGPTNGTMHTLNDIMTLATNRVPVGKTGQATSYLPEDDAWYRTNFGVAWPSTRFTVQADTNCVVDNLTGLMWARNANIPGGTMPWTNAVEYCATNLNVTGYGGYTDWRLPNVRELHSLINFGSYNPALPSGHPFNNVVNSYYWSGTTYIHSPAYACYVYLNYGYVYYPTKVTAYYFWPVRGGGE